MVGAINCNALESARYAQPEEHLHDQNDNNMRFAYCAGDLLLLLGGQTVTEIERMTKTPFKPPSSCTTFHDHMMSTAETWVKKRATRIARVKMQFKNNIPI